MPAAPEQEVCHLVFTGQPRQRALSGEQVGRVRRAGIFPAEGAVADKKMLEVTLDLKADLATQAGPFCHCSVPTASSCAAVADVSAYIQQELIRFSSFYNQVASRTDHKTTSSFSYCTLYIRVFGIGCHSI